MFISRANDISIMFLNTLNSIDYPHNPDSKGREEICQY